MTSDNMVKVGRGGAGNYHAAPVNKDPASLAPSRNQIARATQPASAPTLTGRGGAGNVVSEPNAAAHAEGKLQDLETGGSDAVQLAAAAASASSNPHHGRLAGRGGAGNWHDTATEAAEARLAKEAQHSAQAQKKVIVQVDGELRRPEPTHTRIRHCERRHNR